jgi:hypothetical protein
VGRTDFRYDDRVRGRQDWFARKLTPDDLRPGLFPDLRPARAFRFGEQVAWMVEDAALNR